MRIWYLVSFSLLSCPTIPIKSLRIWLPLLASRSQNRLFFCYNRPMNVKKSAILFRWCSCGSSHHYTPLIVKHLSTTTPNANNWGLFYLPRGATVLAPMKFQDGILLLREKVRWAMEFDENLADYDSLLFSSWHWDMVPAPIPFWRTSGPIMVPTQPSPPPVQRLEVRSFCKWLLISPNRVASYWSYSSPQTVVQLISGQLTVDWLLHMGALKNLTWPRILCASFDRLKMALPSNKWHAPSRITWSAATKCGGLLPPGYC